MEAAEMPLNRSDLGNHGKAVGKATFGEKSVRGRLLSFPRPRSVLSQIPKCEALGATTFCGWSDLSQ
jgi:hypothetical protein